MVSNLYEIEEHCILLSFGCGDWQRLASLMLVGVIVFLSQLTGTLVQGHSSSEVGEDEEATLVSSGIKF